MSDENKRVDEEVEKTVEDLKKQIEEINREAEDAGSQQSSEVKEKIEAAAKKAIEILNQGIDQLKLLTAQVQDSDTYRKTMSQVKATTDKAVAESRRLFHEIKTDPKLNKAVEEIKKSVSDVGEKVSGCVKSGLDELKSNEDLMEKVDQIKDGTAALVEKGQRAVKDFTSKPEVQQNIEKAKDVTIDVAEKTVDALKNWLSPQPAAEAEPEAKPENEEEKENSAEHEESNNL